MFVFISERERAGKKGRERERERENLKRDPHSVQSHLPTTLRSGPHQESDAEPAEPPRRPDSGF